MFSKHDLHEAMGYRLGEMPFCNPPTPQEMRKGLARAQYYCTILNRVANMAEHEGWTGEDKYAAAAFYLLLQNEQLMDNAMRRAMLEPMPFTFPDRPLVPTKDATFDGSEHDKMVAKGLYPA
jgi:hypothetical protein